MKMKRFAYSLLLLLLSLAVILSACGGTSGTGGTTSGGDAAEPTKTGGGDTSAEQPAPKEVEFTIGYAPGDPATKQAMEKAIEAFTAAYPHIKLKNITEVTSASYLDWLKTKDAVGEFPDLVELRDVKVFVDAGKVAELPEELHGLFATLPEYNGKVYTAPIVGNSPNGIIYSKKAYADAGITELPKTYDEFLAIQEKLKATGISPIVVGGKDIWHMGFWVNYFLINGVYADDPDWNAKRTAQTASFTDPIMVQSIEDYKQLFRNDVDKGWLSTADNQTASMLVTGKAAQLYSGPWMFSQIEEADPSFEFGFYAIPNREGKTYINGLPTLQGWALSSEAAQDPDKVEAMTAFIQFFFTKDNYTSFLKGFSGIPTTKEEISYEASEPMQEVLRLMQDPTVEKRMMINNWYGDNAIPTQFRNWFYKLMQELVLNDGDVTDYMRQADAEYDNNVKANQQ